MRLIKIAFDDINDITLTSAPKHEKFSGDGLKGFDFSSAPLKPIYKSILTGQTFSTFLYESGLKYEKTVLEKTILHTLTHYAVVNLAGVQIYVLGKTVKDSEGFYEVCWYFDRDFTLSEAKAFYSWLKSYKGFTLKKKAFEDINEYVPLKDWHYYHVTSGEVFSGYEQILEDKKVDWKVNDLGFIINSSGFSLPAKKYTFVFGEPTYVLAVENRKEDEGDIWSFDRDFSLAEARIFYRDWEEQLGRAVGKSRLKG